MFNTVLIFLFWILVVLIVILTTIGLVSIAYPEKTKSRYVCSKRVKKAYAKVAEIKYKVKKEKRKKVVNLVAIRRWENELKKPAALLYKVRGDNYAIR